MADFADNLQVPERVRPTWVEEMSELIRHGRDREAAALAADNLHRSTQGAPMDPRDQLDMILPVLNELVASLDETQLDAQTPCAKFAVRDVLGHMVGGATVFASAFRGDPPREPSAPDDLVAAFPAAMADLRAAVDSPGALERTIHAPLGDVPGDAFARFVALDGVVHAWDIATATNQPYDPPAELVAEVDAFAHQAIAPDMRDGDTFAAPVDPPAGASPLVQLIAFTGRSV